MKKIDMSVLTKFRDSIFQEIYNVIDSIDTKTLDLTSLNSTYDFVKVDDNGIAIPYKLDDIFIEDGVLFVSYFKLSFTDKEYVELFSGDSIYLFSLDELYYIMSAIKTIQENMDK